MQQYGDDPVGFVREVLGVEPWQRQAEILEALRASRRVTVRSAHGVGKSWLAACAVLWFLYCRGRADRPVAVLTTAPTHRQVKEILWREIRRRFAAANGGAGPPRLPGRCLETALRVSEDRFALGLTTDEADRFQGFHAPHLLVVVDEASGVPEEIFDAIDGVLTTEDCRLLLIGNPTQPSGRFYRSHRDPDWARFAISALDSPNLRGVDPADEETLRRPAEIPGLVTARWVAERRAAWGEESPLYRSRVLGEFPDQSEDCLIPLSWIERAMARGSHPEEAPPGPVEIGVDLARFGACESVACVRRGERVVHGEVWRGLDLMQAAGRVAALIRRFAPVRVKVDGVGLGAGVVDRLREQGFRQVVEVNGARAARDAEQYASLRDEIYFGLRERFAAAAIALPRDDVLAGQLAALRYGFTSSGQQKVESKDDLRRRGLPSPDRADALALSFASLPVAARPVFRAGPGRPPWAW